MKEVTHERVQKVENFLENIEIILVCGGFALISGAGWTIGSAIINKISKLLKKGQMK